METTEAIKRWRSIRRLPGVKPYRQDIRAWQSAVRLIYKKSDLLLLSDEKIDPGPGIRALKTLWHELETYMKKHPLFRMSLEPVHVLQGAPPVAVDMAEASSMAGVGPMASVAGAFAENVARAYAGDIAVENGGDVFVRCRKPLAAELFAGDSRVGRLFVEVPSGSWGIASSSGKIGPSLSLGSAWVATVVAETGALADAWATRLANEVKPKQNLMTVLDVVRGAPGVKGAVIVADGEIAIWGLRLL